MYTDILPVRAAPRQGDHECEVCAFGSLGAAAATRIGAARSAAPRATEGDDGVSTAADARTEYADRAAAAGTEAGDV